jgi:lysozyme
MPLVHDWKRVLLLSISFWAQVVGMLVLIVPEVLFAYTGVDTDPALLWWVAILLLAFGLGGRVITQNGPAWVEWFRFTALLGVIVMLALFASSQARASERETAALSYATPLISRWEGLNLNAYLDIVDVPTICYGSTRGIRLGMTKTKAQCDALLREEIAEYRCGWLAYVNSTAYTKYLPATREAAYTSLAYNVGKRGAGRSTATKRLNAGNIAGGCDAIGWWNKAGGRVVRGLVNRRQAETRLCRIGINTSDNP